MKQTFKRIYFIYSILVLSLLSCGASYNTDHTPPDSTQDVEKSFPEQISGLPRSLKQLQTSPAVIGYEATYGDKITIQIMQAKTPAEADAYFKESIVPLFDAMSSHSRGQYNGKWSASGKDKNARIWYGWVNQNWIFVLNASNQDHFDKILENFKYISK